MMVNRYTDYPYRFGARWRPEEDQTLVNELIEGSMNLQPIANYHQRTESAIVSRTVHLIKNEMICLKLILNTTCFQQQRDMRRAEEEQPNIHIELEWPYDRTGCRWTEEDFTGLIWMIYDGVELENIANTLGRSERNVIYQILDRLCEEEIIFTIKEGDE